MTLPFAIWLQLAERMVDVSSAARWVTFGKNGSDVWNRAVRAACAHTGRNKIVMAVGSYHGIGAWRTLYTAGGFTRERTTLI